MLSNQGEIEGSANIGVTGLNVDGAYALTNHFFVGGNFNTSGIKMYELNGGFYARTSPLGRIELQIGADLGSQSGNESYYTPDDHFPYWTCSYHTNLNSIFFQPIMASIGKVGEIGFGFRFEYTSFPGFYFESQDFDGSPSGATSTIVNSWNNQLFSGAMLYWAIGNRHVRLKMQVEVRIPNYNSSSYLLTPFQPYYSINCIIGLQIRLFNRWEENKPNPIIYQ